MTGVPQVLVALQARTASRSDPDRLECETERLGCWEVSGLLDIEFYGLASGQVFQELLEALSRPDLARSVRSLVFRGPDEGANGTREWDFGTLLDTDIGFSCLTSLTIEPTDPDHHNWSIVGTGYDEQGQLSKWLAKSPVLRSLTSPSAPGATFFQCGCRPLHRIRVQAGYNHQSFLSLLGQSHCFPLLACLDYGEHGEEGEAPGGPLRAPVADYFDLFQSAVSESLAVVTLRNPLLLPEDLQRLSEMRPNVQLRVIRTAARYVRTPRKVPQSPQG